MAEGLAVPLPLPLPLQAITCLKASFLCQCGPDCRLFAYLFLLLAALFLTVCMPIPTPLSLLRGNPKVPFYTRPRLATLSKLHPTPHLILLAHLPCLIFFNDT